MENDEFEVIDASKIEEADRKVRELEQLARLLHVTTGNMRHLATVLKTKNKRPSDVAVLKQQIFRCCTRIREIRTEMQRITAPKTKEQMMF